MIGPQGFPVLSELYIIHEPGSLKQALIVLLILRAVSVVAQDTAYFNPKSLLYNLSETDTVIVYQCLYREAAEGSSEEYNVPAGGKAYTQSYKTVICQKNGFWFAYTYTTAIQDQPNRKFSGLKIRERPYWQFKGGAVFEPSVWQLRTLEKLERTGREAMEYDYPVTKHSRNQLIIKRRKKYIQLILDDSSEPVFRPTARENYDGQ